ncbi:uncharacterized protein LOC127861986 [Dreissena polymorpha]|uniref:uncharacterized protein LOC127861986 n=1 Tax=Dreissena polymorpha TaxID=45954 RepID=UPI002264EA34|nr:uncharacterized protein LOC127861986 [Dreissena polymorpha]
MAEKCRKANKPVTLERKNAQKKVGEQPMMTVDNVTMSSYTIKDMPPLSGILGASASETTIDAERSATGLVELLEFNGFFNFGGDRNGSGRKKTVNGKLYYFYFYYI